jgi:hypothetical protein
VAARKKKLTIFVESDEEDQPVLVIGAGVSGL